MDEDSAAYINGLEALIDGSVWCGVVLFFKCILLTRFYPYKGRR